jgi:hypothetical protein
MLKLLTWLVFFGEIHVFLQVRPIRVFGANRAYLHLETLSCRKHSFQKLTQFSLGKDILDVPASNTMVFFQEIHVLLQLSRIGLLVANRAYLYLQTSKLQEVFLSKTNSILSGKQCA